MALVGAIEVSESALDCLFYEKLELSQALTVRVSKVLGCSAESQITMQAHHTLV